MKLGWYREGPGYYVATTGRTRYLVERPDFAPQWIVRAADRTIGVATTLRDGKQLAQDREDAISRHLRARKDTTQHYGKGH